MRKLLLALALLWAALPAYAVTPDQYVVIFNGQKAQGPPPPPPFAPTGGQELLGDSRLAFGTSALRTGAAAQINTLIGTDYSHWINLVTNNVILGTPSGHYAVSATTSLNQLYRAQGAYTDNVISPACATNTPDYCAAVNGVASSSSADWAVTATGATSDGLWSANALGTQTAFNDPATVAFVLDAVNDHNEAYYTSQTPSGIGTINDLKAMFTTLAAKGTQVFVLDETPQSVAGMAYMESHSVVSHAVTATHTTGWADGTAAGEVGVVDQANNVLVLDAGFPGTPAAGHYTASAGVYNFNVASPPTTVYLTYAWSAGQATSAYEVLIHNYLQDKTSNFTVSGTAYGTPGACNKTAYPHNVCVDIWNTLNGGSGTVATTGLLADGLHPSEAGGIIASKAIQAAITATYPSYTVSLAQAPKGNNWYANTGNGAAVTYGNGVLIGAYTAPVMPGSMQGALCTAAAAAGNLRIKVNGDGTNYATGSGGSWTGVGTYAGNISGTYNCGTGAWSVTFAAGIKPANNSIIEIDQDPANLALNGLMDVQTGPVAAPACSTNVTCNTGTPLVGWTFGIPASLATALAAGACSTTSPCGTMSETATTVTDADGTWPALKIALAGNLASAGQITIQQNLLATITNRITGGQKFRSGVTASLANGANGHLYGITGAAAEGIVHSSAYQAYPGCTACAFGASTTAVSSNADLGGNIPFTDLAMSTWNSTYPAQTGAIVLPEITDLMDMTGATVSSATQEYNINLNAGPFSGTITLWRGHFKVRTQ